MAALDAETAPSWMPADPAPLGLGAFALTTFILSGHNASFIPDLIWVGPALFYGGLIQLLAGMLEFRNRNVFGATAFSTYGGFCPYVTHIGGWIGIATAAVAWYTSAAGVVNGMAARPVVPVGGPLWGRVPRLAEPAAR